MVKYNAIKTKYFQISVAAPNGRNAPSECRSYPYKAKCGAKENGQKVYMAYVGQEYLDLAEQIRKTDRTKDIYAHRKEKIERFFADAKEKHVTRYTYHRGLTAVTRWVRLKFAAMNLKKRANRLWTHFGFCNYSISFLLFCRGAPFSLNNIGEPLTRWSAVAENGHNAHLSFWEKNEEHTIARDNQADSKIIQKICVTFCRFCYSPCCFSGGIVEGNFLPAPGCELQIRCKTTIATTSRKVQQTATAIATDVATMGNIVKKSLNDNCQRAKHDVRIIIDGQLSVFPCGARKTQA